MNIALFVNSGILAPLRALKRWWREGQSSATRVAATPLIPGNRNAIHLIAKKPVNTGSNRITRGGLKPLRVVRVVEAGQACSSVGRMVISGRMADVCAELDRLAAREAALS